MIYRLLADLVTAVHAGFVLFVALGGFLVLWRSRVAWLHAPAAAYGAAIEFFGWVCPLTPLEVRLRRAAGQAGYAGGFIDHYLRELVYVPMPVWEEIRWWLGTALVVGNAAIYWWVWKTRRASGDEQHAD